MYVMYVNYLAIRIQIQALKKESGSRAEVALNQIADQVKTFLETIQFIDPIILFIPFHTLPHQ
jgi:hypothetical protein